MTLYQLWDLASYIAGKFPNGGAIPPSRFNILLPECVDEYVQTCLNEIIAASASQELYNKVLSTTPLIPFKKTDSVVPDNGTGIGTLPTDYLRYIVAHSTTNYTVGSSVPAQLGAKIDIVNDEQFTARRYSIFTRADIQPFGKIVAGNIAVVPFNVGAFTLDYFRKPTTPVMDWCIDTLNPTKMVYMPAGSYIQVVGVTNILYDSNDDVLYSGVTKGNMTYLPFPSATVELEWGTEYQYKFVFMLLQKIGVNLSEDTVLKYAMEMSK